MKRIGICDDNEVLLEKYSGMINKISIEKGLDIEIVKFCSGIELLDFLKEDAQGIDIIFLDILMDYLNGVETAEKIREIKSNAIIIFLTSSEEYIFETIKVKSFAYLMKDELTEESLENILLKAVKKIDEQRENVFCFEKNNEIYQISFQDICFIKFYGGYCYIHHWDGLIFENSNPDIFEDLKNKGFFKVDSQYIIGLRYIDSIEKKQVILSDSSHSRIPIKKEHEKELKLAFADFMLQSM